MCKCLYTDYCGKAPLTVCVLIEQNEKKDL